MGPAVSVLRRLGLTQYEAKTYVALVGLGPSIATDIAEAADVPRTRIYSVLSDLEDADWVEAREGRPKIFQAARPGDRIGQLKDELVEEIDTIVPALEAQYEEEATRFGGPVWLLDTEEAIARRTLEMVRASREELMLVAMFGLPCDGPQLDEAIENAIDRGVRVRIVAADRQRAVDYLGLGADVRVTRVPPRFLFVDDRQALLAYEQEAEGGTGASGVWVPAPQFVDHIGAVPAEIWGMAQPIDIDGAHTDEM